MFSVSTVDSTTATPTIKTTTTTSARVVDKRKHHFKRGLNVMQHSPAVVYMCVQHSQQQVPPMLNNFMCMRMRGWHNNSHSNNNCLTIKGTTFKSTTTTKTVLKRSKGLRKKRDICIIRRNICGCRRGFRF